MNRTKIQKNTAASARAEVHFNEKRTHNITNSVALDIHVLHSFMFI